MAKQRKHCEWLPEKSILWSIRMLRPRSVLGGSVVSSKDRRNFARYAKTNSTKSPRIAFLRELTPRSYPGPFREPGLDRTTGKVPNRMCDPLARRQAGCLTSTTRNVSACREGYAKAAPAARGIFDHQCKTTFATQMPSADIGGAIRSPCRLAAGSRSAGRCRWPWPS